MVSRTLRRVVISIVAAVLFIGLGVMTANAQSTSQVKFGPDGKLLPLADGFPSHGITIWTAFPPGHSDEVYARTLLEEAQKYSPVPITVQPGSAGPPLWYEVWSRWKTLPAARGAKDGYYVMVMDFGSAPIRLETINVGPWTLQDVKNAALMVTEQDGMVLASSPNEPWKNLQGMLAYAKAHPKKVRVATSAIGSGVMVDGAVLASDAGVQFTFLPNKGVARAQQVVLGGGAELVTTQTSAVAPLVQAGQLVPLLQWASQRSPDLPNTPTAGELGYNGQGATRGLIAYPTTPAAHKAWLEALFTKAAQGPAYAKRIKNLGLVRLNWGPDKIDQFLTNVNSKVTPVINSLGLNVHAQN